MRYSQVFNSVFGDKWFCTQIGVRTKMRTSVHIISCIKQSLNSDDFSITARNKPHQLKSNLIMKKWRNWPHKIFFLFLNLVEKMHQSPHFISKLNFIKIYFIWICFSLKIKTIFNVHQSVKILSKYEITYNDSGLFRLA